VAKLSVLAELRWRHCAGGEAKDTLPIVEFPDRAFALELSYGSTCGLEPEENEEAVRRVLADLSILRLGRREVFASVWRSF